MADTTTLDYSSCQPTLGFLGFKIVSAPNQQQLENLHNVDHVYICIHVSFNMTPIIDCYWVGAARRFWASVPKGHPR